MSAVPRRSKPFIRHCTPFDIEELAETMRPEDVLEVFHASGRSPLDALWSGFTASEVIRTIEWDGRVVAIFGVVGTLGKMGSPWMLGTPDLGRCWSLLRTCRVFVEQFAQKYHYLTNAAWSKNDVHLRWIKWLGFTFEGSDVRNGETFLHFHRST